MHVFDPNGHCMKDLESFRTLSPVDEYIPVESTIPGSWFVVYAPTGRSCRIDELEPETAVRVRRAISFPEVAEGKGDLLDEGRFDSHLMKAIFVVGAGGSGKSSIADAMFGGTGLKVINADKHLERFLRELEIPPSQVGQHYGLFKQARDLMKKEFQHYSGQRLGLVVDSTGWDYPRVANPAQRLRALGYDLFMVVVRVPLDVALARNRRRAEEGGRFVPDSFVEDAWRGLERNLKKYIQFFGPKNMHVVENDTEVSDEDWVSIVKPKLHVIGSTILNRPLANKLGQRWLTRQLGPVGEHPVGAPPGADEGLAHPPGASLCPPLSRLQAILEAVTLPTRARVLKHALTLARAKVREHGRLYVVPEGRAFEVRECAFSPPYYIEVDVDRAAVYRQELDGVMVQTSVLREDGGSLIEEPREDLLPLPLDEKHWRDDPKDFRTRLQIVPEKKRPDSEVFSIGKSEKDQKWYGWSHRAFHGFGVGDKSFPKPIPWKNGEDLDSRDKREKEQQAKAPVIKTDAEARQSAVYFADWVS